jgi:hypothetical protein
MWGYSMCDKPDIEKEITSMSIDELMEMYDEVASDYPDTPQYRNREEAIEGTLKDLEEKGIDPESMRESVEGLLDLFGPRGGYKEDD